MMSRRTWGITLTVLALAVVAAMVFWYARRDTATPPGEQKGTELVEMIPAKTSPDRVAQPGDVRDISPEEAREEGKEENYEYILRSHDGYVAVYEFPGNEIYEYTDVILETLPEGLQEEILEGKYLKNEEELYNFLENYTS